MKFKELCPVWDLIINNVIDIPKEDRMSKLKELEANEGVALSNSHTCVMGEAYGFSNIYERPLSDGHCKECNGFAVGDEGFVSVIVSGDRNQLSALKKRFMEHATAHLKVKEAIKINPKLAYIKPEVLINKVKDL